MSSNTIRRWGVAVTLVGMLAALAYGVMGAADADPTDGGGSCFRGDIWCAPAWLGPQTRYAPPSQVCSWTMGRWVDVGGHDCRTGR